jgi:hypothetical protein
MDEQTSVFQGRLLSGHNISMVLVTQHDQHGLIKANW